METKTVLFIILAVIAALLVAIFQYFYKNKRNSKTNLVLALLRFIGLFGILLLIINPQFSKTNYTLVKPNLVVLVDNSTSISTFEKDVNESLNGFVSQSKFSDRFKVSSYSFGGDIQTLDSLNFKERNTNIQKALTTIEEVYAREESAIIILSDGNQTLGSDYSFFKSNEEIKIFPVVLGDTTKFKDIALGPIVINKYAFLKNKFPLETYVTYQGDTKETISVVISLNGSTVYQDNITFDSKNNYKSIRTEISANSVGFKEIIVNAVVLPDERNTNNNRRITSIEVIDEKTNIAIISKIMHPDLGALKKSIETNEQRQVSIMKPDVATSQLEEIDLFVFYQPDRSFKNTFEFAKKKNSNSFIITGDNTDYSFLNVNQNAFEIEEGYPTQEVFGTLNSGYSKYDITDFDLADFPPLDSDAGPILFKVPNETLLGTRIKGLDIQKPLWTVYQENARKQALLMGENIWKWRIQTYRNTGDFKNFDNYLANLIRYLTSSKNKSRLNVDYEKRYEGSTNVVLTATYFDEAFLFDPNAKISIAVMNKDSGQKTTSPMVLKNGFFESDLSNLLPGEYDFKVTVQKETYVKTGSFIISEFDLENQFVSSNYDKMNQLAENNGGSVYFPSQLDDLNDYLIASDAFVPTEKKVENIVSLIDFKILLGIIALAFATEWFIRKYNGLI